MARRVNTKFVVVMSVSLAAAVGVLGTIKVVQHFRTNNPVLVQAQGEAAEQKGDLKSAAERFAHAGDILAGRHQAGADALYIRAADLCEKIAGTTTSADDAVSYDQFATGLWLKAMEENPRNKELNEKLLDDQYERVQYVPVAKEYQELGRLAEAMIKLEDSAKAETYFAEAKYQNVLLTITNNTPPTVFDEVQQHLDAAVKLDAKYGPAVALQAEKNLQTTRMAFAKSNVDFRDPPKADAPPEVKKGWQDSIDSHQKSLNDIAAALNTFIQENGIQLDVAGALADVMQVQYADMQAQSDAAEARYTDIRRQADAIAAQQKAGVAATQASPTLARAAAAQAATLVTLLDDATKQKQAAKKLLDDATAQRDAVVALLERAYNDSHDLALGDRLVRVYLAVNQRDKAEDLLKASIKRGEDKPSEKDNPINYWRLAEFYRMTGDPEHAVDEYKEVRQHTAIGTGIEAQMNRYYQITSLEDLAWLTMDMAEEAGATTDKGKSWMKEASDNTDTLRSSHVNPGILFMLDGRTQLINRDTATAIDTLHKAEGSLNSPNMQDRYRQTEILLADANIAEHQSGLALELIDKALQIDGRNLNLIVKRAELLIDVGRFDEAKTLLLSLLGPKDVDTGEYKNAKALGEKGVAAMQRLILVAENGAGANVDPDAMRAAGAALLLARQEFGEGDYESAVQDATSVLSDATSSDGDKTDAYQVAIIGQSRLNKKEDAKKTAAEALAKFPKNPTFQAISAALSQPGDPNSPEVQKAMIEAVTDEYAKQTLYASMYVQQKDYDNALASLQKAQAALDAAPDHDKQTDLIDRGFNLSLNLAAAEKDPKKKEGYFAQAQSYVTKAEKLNLDGTGGKLYEGRLAMVRSDNKDGLKLLEQAVAQRPDYAVGRIILGQFYLRVNNTTSALEQFRQAARVAPNNLTALQYAISLLLDKGDSASVAEAQGLLKTGLSLSPYNRTFVSFKDFLATGPAIDDAIRTHEDIAKRNPGELSNTRSLAALYVKRANQEDPSLALDDRDRAIALIEPVFKKTPDDLRLADTLAHLKLDKTHELAQAGRIASQTDLAKMIAEGTALYEPFASNKDEKVRFAALLLKAKYTQDAGNIDGAAEAYMAADKVEPAGSDLAKRYLADMDFDHAQWADAEALYTKIMADSSDAGSRDMVIRRLIETLLREAQPQKRAAAAPYLAELLKRHPDDRQGLVLKAFSDILDGNASTALTSLNRAIAADDKDIEALYYRAYAYIVQGKFDEAIHDLRTAQSADTKNQNLNVRLLLAQVYEQTMRYGEASLEYSETITLHPDNMNLRVAYTDFLIALAREEKKFPADCDVEPAPTIRALDPKSRLLDQVKDASEKFPTAGARWYMLYAQLLDLRGTPDLANNIYKKLVDDEATKHDPAIEDAYIGSLLELQEYQKAADTTSTLVDSNAAFIAANPQFVTLYLKRAKAYVALKREADGLKDVNLALSVAADVAKTKNDLSVYLMVLRDATDTDQAAPLSSQTMETALQARIAADPTEVIAKLGLVQMMLLDNKMADALGMIQSVALPSTNPAIESLALRQRALVESQNKQYPAAEVDFKELLKANPYDVESLNNYAFMLADNLSRPQEAIKEAQQALDVLSTRSSIAQVFAATPTVKDTMGWGQFLSGDTNGSIQTFKEALKLQPLPSAYYHLAMAYEKLGDAQSIQMALDKTQAGIKLCQGTHDPILPDLQKLQEKLSKATPAAAAGATR